MSDSERPSSTVSLNWQGGFRFDSHDSHGHSLTLDAPQGDGARFEGFMPGDMLLSALAGCSGIDVVNILERMRQKVEGIEISVKGHQNPEPPWTWEDIHLHYTIHGSGLKDHLVRRAINLSENKYCSIGATVSGRARITSDFDIVEA
ncbi:MAG: OsmC family protein [Dehalococcoidia bacterium]|nr:OsmC family protein [Dehalococcoidia bacterium]